MAYLFSNEIRSRGVYRFRSKREHNVKPYVRVRPYIAVVKSNGQIKLHITHILKQKANLKNKCILGYDPETNILIIMPSPDGDVHVSYGGRRAEISVTVFFKDLNLCDIPAARYEATVEKNNIIVNFNEPLPLEEQLSKNKVAAMPEVYNNKNRETKEGTYLFPKTHSRSRRSNNTGDKDKLYIVRPYVSILKKLNDKCKVVQIKLGIPRKLVHKAGVKDRCNCILGYDPETNILIIMPSPDGDMRLTTSGNNSIICVTVFFKDVNLCDIPARRYEATVDENNIIVDLNAPLPLKEQSYEVRNQRSKKDKRKRTE